MNITMLAPPEATGDIEKDVEELREWCNSIHTQLKKIFYNINSSNITEVDGELIWGTIPLNNASIKGNRLNITNDTFTLTNSNSSNYLKLSGDKLIFCGEVVTP